MVCAYSLFPQITRDAYKQQHVIQKNPLLQSGPFLNAQTKLSIWHNSVQCISKKGMFGIAVGLEFYRSV